MPVPFAVLTLSGPANARTTTDSDGHFVFDGLESAAYTVRVEAEPGLAVPDRRAVPLDRTSRSDLVFVRWTSPPPLVCHIQGAGHRSPQAGATVTGLPGIVTATRGVRGFYLQNPLPDARPETSEGIYVTHGGTWTVRPGDLVLVDGRVQEVRGGGGSLSVTTIRASAIHSVGGALPVPEPVTLGGAGRLPPDQVLSIDVGDVELGLFDPEREGIDFYESLEGMLLRVDGALVVGPSHGGSGEFQILGDGGMLASGRTSRGGLVVRGKDLNPERITVDLRGTPEIIPHRPLRLAVGDRFPAPVVGILDYDAAGYKLLPTEPLAEPVSGALPRTVATGAQGSHSLRVATFNVENLSSRSSPKKVADLAFTIVHALGSPDVVALQEVQDDSGVADDGVVSAHRTYQVLTDAIQDIRGAPRYEYREIAPKDGQDGGQPGGNIRVALLYNPARVGFVDRAGGGEVGLLGQGQDTRLSASPGLIGPTHGSFRSSRKPLACEIRFAGRRIFVIVLHLASRSGDAAIFGRWQPPTSRSEGRRYEQAGLVAEFVREIRERDPDAHVVALGDFNDDGQAGSVGLLKAAGLVDLAETLLPEGERYTYVYRGNGQDLDHIMVTPSLIGPASPRLLVLHRYAEYPMDTRQTDHDPLLAVIELGDKIPQIPGPP
jgi:hypothetical protein